MACDKITYITLTQKKIHWWSLTIFDLFKKILWLVSLIVDSGEKVVSGRLKFKVKGSMQKVFVDAGTMI